VLVLNCAQPVESIRFVLSFHQPHRPTLDFAPLSGYRWDMLQFSLLGFPVAIEGWFWLSCVLLGGGINARQPEDWMEVAGWTVVVLVSILVHELGHALAAKRYGVSPIIKLHGFGGATFLPDARFSRFESIVVSASGPAASLALGFVMLGVSRTVKVDSWLLAEVIRDSLFVNFFWTFINLLPIQPLDGGQILREILGPRFIRATSLIGCAAGILVCIWSISVGQIFLALFIAMLAYYNFRQIPVEGGVIKH